MSIPVSSEILCASASCSGVNNPASVDAPNMLTIGLSLIKLSIPPLEVPGLVVALLNNLPLKKPPTFDGGGGGGEIITTPEQPITIVEPKKSNIQKIKDFFGLSDDDDDEKSLQETLAGAIENQPEFQSKIDATVSGIMANPDLAGLGTITQGKADGGPIGGIMDLETGRQQYFLGKLVKKVGRTVKKIAKSPLGKAALTAATIKFGGPLAAKVFPSTFGSAASSPFLRAIGRGQFFGDTGIFSAGKTALFGSNAVGPNVPEGILSKIGPLSAITAVSALAGLMTPKQEQQAQLLSEEEGIDIEAARRMILQAGTSGDKRGLAFRAEGGRIGYQEGSKEPVAKKTMPLLDMGGKEMD